MIEILRWLIVVLLGIVVVLHSIERTLRIMDFERRTRWATKPTAKAKQAARRP